MKLLMSLLIFLSAFCSADAATIYVNPTGANGEYGNFQAAFAGMSGGDTLVVRDGTYTGATNIIQYSSHPPVGTSGAWTRVVAEHPGSVFLGEASTETAYFNFQSGLGNCYTEYNGLIFLGGLAFSNGNNYLKFFNCGAGTNIDTTAESNFNISYGDYVLLEDCFAWGGGRYKFVAFQSTHVIFRRCVGRVDAVNMGEPLGGVGFYYASNCEAQNCIIIDSNTPDYWTYEVMVGAFTCPNGTGTNNAFRGCITLNTTMPIHSVAAGYTSGIVYENIIGWGATSGGLLRGNLTYSHSTIGNVTILEGNYAALQQFEGTVSVSNSIIMGVTVNAGALGGGGLASDYNALYGNTVNYYNVTPGAHDITNVNPTTASLLYLLRIEDSSALDGAASDSGDIGATILKQIGTSGTLWGEAGYATTTETDLWPFPNESIIKTAFLTYDYAGVDEARGFCASGTRLDGVNPITLTSYIWEYLGNEIPTDIYGSTPTYDTPIVEILTESQSTTSETITIIGTLTTDSELTGTGVDVNGIAATADDGTWDEASEAWTALGVTLSLGANTITATGTDSNSGTDSDTTVVTRAAAPQASITNTSLSRGVLRH